MRIKQYPRYVLCMALMVLGSLDLSSQCPDRSWNTSNVGDAYIASQGKKAIYGDFTNLQNSQYVNDGRIFLFGDIQNEGYYGDGNGIETIVSCDNSLTTIFGGGATEFNVVRIDNPGNVRIKQRVDVKRTLRFQNGLIHTDRKNDEEVVYFLEGANHISANHQRHIDGTVSKQGGDPFIFPLGDADHQSPLKIIGRFPFDIYTAAYYSLNLNFFDFLYPGTFPRDQKDFNVLDVQKQEFWTLKGGQATPITLFWSDYSKIDELVDDIRDLVVVGWDGEKWQSLGNTNVVQIFNTGQIQSENVIPNQYEAFTFGVLDSDGDDVVDSEDIDPFDPCSPNPTAEACVNRICVDVQTSLFIEGGLTTNVISEYDMEMGTQLYDFGYLPGLRPKTLFGIATSAGQPYDVNPWNYFGIEGEDIDEINSVVNVKSYPDDAVDWVLVSVRGDLTAESTVCKQAALVMPDGELIFTDFFDCCGIPDQPYYIVIEHRNHLPVMTPTTINAVDGVMSFDFRFNQSYVKLLGYGQKEIIPGYYAMYAGNGDQVVGIESVRDINANDISLWAMDNGKHSGYYFQDYDLSGDVNVHDKALWILNNGIFTDVDF